MSDIKSKEEIEALVEKHAKEQDEFFLGGVDSKYKKGFTAGYNAANKWVKCSDELPKIDCKTLVCDQDGDIAIIDFISKDDYLDTAWYITHWMPLPKKPTV